MKRSHKILSVLVFNVILATGIVAAGFHRNDIYYFFQEKQAATFLSALLLGMTSLCAFTLSFMRQRNLAVKRSLDFWFISAFGFFYLSMDEYFMLHEGMDTPLLKLFGKDPQFVNWDGLVFALLAVFGITFALKCWRDVTRQKDFVWLCVLATACLAGMIVFDMLDQNNSVIKVCEEIFKITGVTFFFAAYLSAMLEQIGQALAGQQPYP